MKTCLLLALILGSLAFIAFAKGSALDARLSELTESKKNEAAKLDELRQAIWRPLNYCGLIATSDNIGRTTYFRFPQKIEKCARRIRNTNQTIASIVRERQKNDIRKLSSLAIISASLAGCGLVGMFKRYFEF